MLAYIFSDVPLGEEAKRNHRPSLPKSRRSSDGKVDDYYHMSSRVPSGLAVTTIAVDEIFFTQRKMTRSGRCYGSSLHAEMTSTSLRVDHHSQIEGRRRSFCRAPRFFSIVGSFFVFRNYFVAAFSLHRFLLFFLRLAACQCWIIIHRLEATEGSESAELRRSLRASSSPNRG